jgi:3-deoxy-D-manno-octulosonate 8-phosphate phosphatase (KDO 8-P phosphatase)
VKLIAHRGNFAGQNVERENTVAYLEEALAEGYDVEFDVFYHYGNILLGHDGKVIESTTKLTGGPLNKIPSIEWLRDSRKWVHCKDKESFEILRSYGDIQCFMHEDEPYVFVANSNKAWVHSKVIIIPIQREISPSTYIVHESSGDVHMVAGVYGYNVSKFKHLQDKRWDINTILLDVDGVLTNGKKQVTQVRETAYVTRLDVAKEFCDKDWTAIKRMRAAGLRVIMISSDDWNHRIALQRDIEWVYAKTTGEFSKLNEIRRMGVDLSKCIYVGDDYYDLELMWHVELPYCPLDAIEEVKRVCRVLPAKGGENCIASLYDSIKSNLKENFPHER